VVEADLIGFTANDHPTTLIERVNGELVAIARVAPFLGLGAGDRNGRSKYDRVIAGTAARPWKTTRRKDEAHHTEGETLPNPERWLHRGVSPFTAQTGSRSQALLTNGAGSMDQLPVYGAGGQYRPAG